MNKRTQNIAIGGICLAGSVLSLYFASIIPSAELTLYAVSSLFVAIMILEGGMKSGWLMYIATVLLALILIPNKLAIVPYGFFFGLYGIIKYYAEKIHYPALQVACKVAVFLVVFGVGFFFFKDIFFGNIQIPDFPWAALALAGVVFLLLYDFIFSMLIQLYRRRIRRIEKDIVLEKDK